MNITWIKNSSRKEALLLGVSALALFAAKPAEANTTINGSATAAANETGSVSFTTDNSLTVNDGVTIAGTVDNNGGAAGSGYLVFAGSSTLAGIVGSSNSLNSITAGVNGSNVQFDANVTVTNIAISSDGSVTMGTGTSITGVVENSSGNAAGGELVFAGDGTVTGLVGSSNALSTITAGVTSTNVQFDANVVASELNITSDGSVTFADGVSLSGAIDDSAGTNGEVVFAGSGTIGSTIGTANALTSLTAGVNGSNVQFDGNVAATAIDLSSDGSVTLANNVTVSGIINNTSGTASTGELVLAGNATVSGTVGSTNTLSTITAGVTATNTQFDSNVSVAAINISSDGSVTMATGTSISGTVDNTSGAAGNGGELVFAGNGTVGGVIGSSNALTTITAGVTATNVQFDANVTTTDLAISSDGSVTMGTGTSITGVVDNTSGNAAGGELVFAGDGTVTGLVGSSNAMSTITAGVTSTNVQFDANVNASELNITSDGSVTFADGVSLSGTIDDSAGTNGEVVFAGSGTIGSTIGTANALTSLTAGVNGSNVQFDGNVAATAIDLSSDGSVTLANNVTVSGIINNTSGTASTGELVLAGNATVSGTVGSTNTLSTITAGVTATNTQFDSNVSVAAINISSDGSVTMATGTSITGTVDNTSGAAGNGGELVFAGDGTVTGLIGSSNALTTVTAGVNATNVQFDANVAAATLNITSDGSVTFADGVSLSGAIDDSAGANGEVVFAGSSTVGSTIGTQNALTSLTAGVNASNVQFDGEVNATTIDLSSDGSVTLATGVTVSGIINNTSGTASTGELVLVGNNTIAGTVGSTNALSTITAGVTATDAQFTSDVTATTLNLSSDGSVTFGNGASFSGLIDNTSGAASNGELVFAGSSTIAGTVGSTNTLSTITAGVTATNTQFDSNVSVAAINISSDGSVTMADGTSITGAVDNTSGAAGNGGELVFAGSGTVTGLIGSSNALTTLTAGVTATNVQFDANVAAAELNITSDGSVTFANGASLSGNIDDSAGANGEVVFAGSSTVGGTIGTANALTSLTAGVNATDVQFDGNVAATAINIGSDGSVTLANNVTVSGLIDNTSGSSATGELTLAGNATVAGAVGSSNSLSTITAGVNGTETQFSSNVTATVINISSDGSVTMADATTITGAVDNTSGVASTGELRFSGDGTVTGTIGTTNALSTVSAGINAKTVQFDSNVIAAALNLTSDGSVIISDGASVSGLIDAVDATSGDVTFSGNSTVGSQVGSNGRLASVTAGAASSTTQFDGTVFDVVAIGLSTGTTKFSASAPTLSGNVTVSNGGTLELSTAAGASITVGGAAGNLDLGGSSSTLKLAMTDVGTFAALTVAGTANMQNANIYIDTTGATSAITSGTTITIVNSTGALSNGDVVVASTAAAVTFTSTSDANNVYLTTSRTGGGYAGAATGSSTSVVGGVATALNGLVTSATAGSTMATLVAKLDTLSAQTLGETLTQLSPTSVAATTGASMATTTAAVNVVGTRTENVRLASNGSGVASGEAMRGLGVWAQGFGVYGNQDKRNGYDGYDVATGGLALGADTRFFKNMRTGVSFSYARSGIDATDTTAGNTTDINSYIGSIYTTYEGKPWYLDGVVSFGMHDYDTTRKIAALTQTINGDHKGYQTTVKLGGGYPIQVKKAVITPLASFTYSNLSEGSYTETGGSAALVVDSKSTHSYRSGLGAKIATTFDVKGKAVTPEARAVWSHEFGDNQDTTAKFAGGGAYFTSKADTPARESVNLGVGLNVDLKNNISLSATYDAELKDKYLGHTGTVQVRAEF